MTLHRMDDGTIVDTAKARQTWDEALYDNGGRKISRATGWASEHERLYCSRKGRYYIERWSDVCPSRPDVQWITHRAAAAWLIYNGHSLPEDLQKYEPEAVE